MVYHALTYHMTMWYAFWPCDMIFVLMIYLSKTTENLNLCYLKMSNDCNQNENQICVINISLFVTIAPHTTFWLI